MRGLYQGFTVTLTSFLSRRDERALCSQVGNFTADDKSTNVLLSSPASSRGLGLILIVMIIVSVAFAGLARVGSAAEGTRFLASYGGTAGYQLPLWVNKEFGFSKKVRRRSGNHFDPGGLAEHSGLARREPSVNPNGGVFVSDSRGPRRAGGDRRHLGK